MKKKEEEISVEKRLQSTLNYLTGQGLNPNQILDLVNKLLKVKDISIPLSIFKNQYLSSLENIVKYLRENLLLTFKQISALTNRNHIALAVTYRNAKKKLADKFVIEESSYFIPVSILKDRNLSVLENIVSYLKDTFNLTYHNIALLLNRNDRTIWTVYQRAKKKSKK